MRHTRLDEQLMTASRLRALTAPGGASTRVIFQLEDGTELEAIAMDMYQASETKEGNEKPTAPAVMRFVMAAYARPVAHVGTAELAPTPPSQEAEVPIKKAGRSSPSVWG